MHRDRRSEDQPAIAITSRLQLQTPNTPHSALRGNSIQWQKCCNA